MADPVVHITNGVPDLGTGNITTLGMTINAIGSATSGQSGPLMMGAVTTSSPSYTTGQTNPLSLDLTGALRVNVTGTNNVGGTFSSFGSAFPAFGTAAGAEYLSSPPTLTNGQMVALQTNVNGALKVDGSAITQPISGTITANQGGAWNVGITGTVTVSGTVTSNQGGAPWSMKPDGTTWAMTSTSANVNVTNASIPVTGTFWQTTQPVSGTVAATQSGTWTVQPGNTANTTAWLVTGTGGTFPITATSLPLPSGASTSANQPTNAAQGSTTSGQTGHLMMGAVTTGTPTYTTAQTSPFSLDTSGALRVNVIAGGGGGGTSSTFGSAIPATGTAGGFSDGTNMQLARVFDGDTGVGTQYSLGVLLKTPGSGGAVDFGVSGQPIRIDPTGTTTQPVSGTVGISGTVAATQSGTWTVQPGNTANTTAWLVTGAGGTFPVTGTFWQATQPVSIAATVNVSAAQSGTWTVQQGTPPWTVNGDTASGVTDANNPVKIGGVARTSNPTAVTNGQRVNGIFDKLGKQVVVGALRDVKGVQKTSITTVSETTVVTAGASGVFNDVYAIIITNKSATGVSVDFKDATAGTTRMTLYAPATDTRGFTVPVDSAMVQAAAASNWTATASGAVSSLEITMLYVSNL
jgi:hypothetical protein